MLSIDEFQDKTVELLSKTPDFDKSKIGVLFGLKSYDCIPYIQIEGIIFISFFKNSSINNSLQGMYCFII